jgi:hypothetical protein
MAAMGVLAAAACGGNNPAGANSAGAGSNGASTSDGSGMLGSTGSGEDEFATCASEITAGKPIPVTLFVMMDRSGSMLENQKWANAQTALTVFFQDPKSAGLKVALRFFPDEKPTAGCSAPSCSVAACATPLVDAGELNDKPAYADPHQKKLVEAVQATSPDGQTPMYAALAGATQWAKQAAGSDHRTAVILMTDGEPDGCDENIDHIAALAGDALKSKGVLTYTIGMPGSKQSQLDAIAKAGGSDAAFIIKSGTVTTQLEAALKKIRVSQIACSFTLPKSSDPTKPVDPNLVNVTYGKSGGKSQVIPQVASKAACSSQAWHYDNPDKPTKIELCPDACSAVQSDPDASVRVVLGCATVIL